MSGLDIGLTEGFFFGLVGGISGFGRFSFSRSLSIFPAPGCRLLGLLDVPGSVGIDIPNQLILPRFVVIASQEIIVCLG